MSAYGADVVCERIDAVCASDEPVDARGALTAREGGDWQLIARGRPGRRREWLAGRVLAHRVLPCGASVVAHPDGRPVVVDCDVPPAISIAHSQFWVAVAVGPPDVRVGVDVCDRIDDARIARIVSWLDVRVAGGVTPASATWAALEVVLKLHRLGIEQLIGRRPMVSWVAVDRRHRATVAGFDRAIDVHATITDDHVLAWAGVPWPI